MRKPRPYGKSVYRALALVVQFGINMLVPVCMMTALGVFLDKKLGTSYLMIVLFFVGAIAGAQNIYRMARRVYDETPGKESENTDEDSRGRKEGQ